MDAKIKIIYFKIHCPWLLLPRMCDISEMQANGRHIAGARGYYARRLASTFCNVPDAFNLYEAESNAIDIESEGRGRPRA